MAQCSICNFSGEIKALHRVKFINSPASLVCMDCLEEKFPALAIKVKYDIGEISPQEFLAHPLNEIGRIS